jgi:hypothetical protein
LYFLGHFQLERPRPEAGDYLRQCAGQGKYGCEIRHARSLSRARMNDYRDTSTHNASSELITNLQHMRAIIIFTSAAREAPAPCGFHCGHRRSAACHVKNASTSGLPMSRGCLNL